MCRITVVYLDTVKMFKALHPFTSADRGTLTAVKGELFCGMCRDQSGLWMQAVNSKGIIGYLPANYLELYSDSDRQSCVLFLKKGIANLEKQNMSPLDNHIRTILHHQSMLMNNYEEVVHSLTADVKEEKAKQEVACPEAAAELLQPASGSTEVDKDAESTGGYHDDFANSMATMLTELLRLETDLSYEKCKAGVAVIVQCLHTKSVSLEQLPHIYKALNQEKLPGGAESQNPDVVEMQTLFSNVLRYKNDFQQRGWYLHDDEEEIQENLKRLLSILTMGNQEALEVSIKTDLDCVQNLVQFFQMETRSALRSTMSQIFGALCTMSPVFITNLFYSTLTLELVKDIMSVEDEQRCIHSVILLSMVLSTREPIPAHYQGMLNDEFVNFLLDKIEHCENLRLSDVCVELLLAFNLHFEEPDSNVILAELAKCSEATVLTQNFLKLFNKGEDPIQIFPDDAKMNCVLKFASDLYSLKSTATLLYTNDMKVLIDIIIREITDRSENDAARTEYLSLMHLIMQNSDYKEHQHRKGDLVSALNQIEFAEESTSSDAQMTAVLVYEIRKLL
ncbi:nckipsd [Bugula neritina]|uniref:Nckipsd n=1 Tax=Bugula neritina TaxID=10212 RepID=A0A7J7KLU1_BUGNE|nr:nckipsd [Bugula neritina]